MDCIILLHLRTLNNFLETPRIKIFSYPHPNKAFNEFIPSANGMRSQTSYVYRLSY